MILTYIRKKKWSMMISMMRMLKLKKMKKVKISEKIIQELNIQVSKNKCNKFKIKVTKKYNYIRIFRMMNRIPYKIIKIYLLYLILDKINNNFMEQSWVHHQPRDFKDKKNQIILKKIKCFILKIYRQNLWKKLWNNF